MYKFNERDYCALEFQKEDGGSHIVVRFTFEASWCNAGQRFITGIINLKTVKTIMKAVDDFMCQDAGYGVEDDPNGPEEGHHDMHYFYQTEDSDAAQVGYSVCHNMEPNHWAVTSVMLGGAYRKRHWNDTQQVTKNFIAKLEPLFLQPEDLPKK